ncbi:MAG TPA: hypothetical protein VGZ52_10615 [Acidimicrobiales bacterium]|nr:hypothetical protein [Acidimicrobiales bacterium]
MATASAQDGSAPTQTETRAARNTKYALISAWAVILVLLLRHREVISSDTLSNYIHVWFVADRFWHGHGLPFRMPVLAHGQALAFPYGFIPWMFAVLLWPIMGEWSVTLTLGIGFVGLVLATFWAFPELRRGWWAVAVLVNPAFVEGLLLGQLPFLWAATMLLLGIGCWRTNRRMLAILLVALAQITHAPVLMPIVALLVLWWVRFEPDRRTLLRGWIFSVVVSLPAAVLVFASPVTSQTSPLWSLWVEVETVALRALVVIVPIALVYLQSRELRRNGPALAAAAMVIGQLVTIPISGMGVGWSALSRNPDATARAIPRSTVFVRGATYRVLTFGDGKYGQYAVVRAGGSLDSEFFPESLHRRSFRDQATYASFLAKRGVDYVVVDHRYRKFHTNEEQLLASMTLSSARGECPSGLRMLEVDQEPSFSVYRVMRGCSGPVATN